MKIKINQDGRYCKDGTLLNFRQLGMLIREGHDLDVYDENDVDFSDETLARIVLWDKSDFDFAQILSFIVDKEKLIEIIEHGGIATYMGKKRRGL